ncbi:hydroxymethylglutaryl-CoA lyase [Alkalihalobacillus sp. MEB130]|uniref:hydroxymethylglutaryl-CoA lyase n=1 Tax=Alkalihalobacillus sp. MEB130 TaxID=2976704 RepID=UPI0028DE3586|nr:hydroxymethylglutaryl-CoA lyase [Alkalihalobacillus sp. MEB130]MDT8862049.1 hydroxymethylglutaryl-CoA lyase [Alkalihalobacillus sp. MEB130]
MARSNDVLIREVGPRDGLQNEKVIIKTETKIDWVNQLVDTGLNYIELTSFVHPKWIPALADASEVVKGVKRRDNVTFGALVPNEHGLERALEAGIDEVAVFLSASETHNKKNVNKSIDETIVILKNVIKEAKKAGKSVRGYVSTAFHCPYEGKVSHEKVLYVSSILHEIGVEELSLGDTIGMATPNEVEDIVKKISAYIPLQNLAFHPHDTSGTALANSYAAYQVGIRKFDGSVGGLGGCPYAPGATGNVATEDLVFMFEGMKAHTGIDLEKLTQCAVWIQKHFHHRLPSHNLQRALAQRR